MNRIVSGAILAGSAILGACAPLSQAGLIYSSRAQVGLNVAGGTPETPGFNINIGMNVNDTAYVPVVVGRPCELSNRTDCEQALTPVFGSNIVGNTMSSEKDKGEGATSPAGAPTTPTVPGTKSVQATVSTPQSTPAEDIMEVAEAQRMLESIQRRTEDNTMDALSVYGTFDSNAGAGVPAGAGSGNANLRLGRIFSTGVASQHLTRAVRDAARTQSYAQCLAAVAAAAAQVADATARAEFVRLHTLPCVPPASD